MNTNHSYSRKSLKEASLLADSPRNRARKANNPGSEELFFKEARDMRTSRPLNADQGFEMVETDDGRMVIDHGRVKPRGMMYKSAVKAAKSEWKAMKRREAENG